MRYSVSLPGSADLEDLYKVDFTGIEKSIVPTSTKKNTDSNSVSDHCRMDMISSVPRGGSEK